PAPTDDARVIARIAAGLFAEVDTSAGVRLLGVGVSGLADWVQQDLFTSAQQEAPSEAPEPADEEARAPRRWVPGMDVAHAVHGPGWVWGSGRGRVTVRFETAETPPGPVRTFADDDTDLSPA
ncbi:MAG TPA: DNA polymerase IV, partial [Jiangellaceae bacterium]|nr:DNA polymerase IV [Jiangellaceae bacterium]